MILFARAVFGLVLLCLLLGVLWNFGIAQAVTAVPCVSPVTHGRTDRGFVSLMFNVDWGEEFIPPILAVLRQKDCKVTFFPTGEWALDHPEILRAIVWEGHEVGNHGMSHLHVGQMSASGIKSLIVEGDKALREISGKEPSKLFAPPYGEWTEDLVKAALEVGYKTILWTADTVDWQKPPPETILRRAVDGARNGALILMHPTAQTLEVLPSVIDELRSRGFRIVPVGENIAP